jgi:transcription antitermination factor NusG
MYVVRYSEDKPNEADKYKVLRAGVKRLNVNMRDLERQKEFQDTMTNSGWYMVAVPETREERSATQIMGISGTKDAGGVELDAWVPRIPPAGYVVSESDAAGLTPLQLLQGVPVEGAEKPFGGFLLLRMSVNQTLLESLDAMYAFKSFATSGITKYGTTRKQTGHKPQMVADDRLQSMMEMCAVKVVSDEEAKAAVDEAKRVAARAEREAAMGEIEPMSEEDLAALRAEAGAPAEGASSSGGGGGEEGEPSTKPQGRPEGAVALEVHDGPFKGFKGYVTGTNEDGTVDAQLTIFGRETSVTLEAHEYTAL